MTELNKLLSPIHSTGGQQTQDINMEETIYFKEESEVQDDKRLIDFVLAWEEKPIDPDYAHNRRKREIFENNLENEGLDIERDECGPGNGLKFLKIHAPLEVLQRYAEILKIRMPLKKFSAELLHADPSGAEGAEMLEFKLTSLDPTLDGKADAIRIPLVSDVHEGIKTGFEKLQEPFYPNVKGFHESHSQYTAEYSRDKEYLFDHACTDFFTPSTRSRILEFLLKRKRFSDNKDDDFAFGISKLIADGAYLAAYPLHDGALHTEGSTRKMLYDEWASVSKFWKYQPLDHVRDYFGVKIGFYFAWLGFYTAMLIPPSIVGILCLLYGLATYDDYIPTQDICSGVMSNTTMCPICDKFCDYWSLSDSCMMVKAKYFFDNDTTVFYAAFMSIWAVLFLEMWKRYSAEITHRWDVYGYDPEEEHPRPEYMAQLRDSPEFTVNFVTRTSEPKPPFWRMKLPGVLISWTSVLMFILLALVTVLAIILYRMSMVVALATVNDNTIRSNWSLFISMTGASINLVLILIFNYIYEQLAFWLTEKELHRTQSAFDDALTLKIYLFQFVNYYSSIFYIAFFKGQYIGTPNHYHRYLGYRQEECSPGGCFMELCIQLAIIFMGKQFLLSVMEYYMPVLWKIFNLLKLRQDENSGEKDHATPQHIRDFKLVEWGQQGLFHEYLEMIIQYGFITVFVSAFPLAPFFALCNNILEIRLDAKKILVNHRRPIAQKVRSIGVWFDIMETLGRVAVIANAFILAITSEFIPKCVYKYFYSKDGSLEGYVDFSLSYFDPEDLDLLSVRLESNSTDPSVCRYPDFKHEYDHSDQYQPNSVFWHVWFARVLFVVVFENVICLLVMSLKLIIPDVSDNLKQKVRREAYLTKEIIIRNEQLRARAATLSKDKSDSAPQLHSPITEEKQDVKSCSTGDVRVDFSNGPVTSNRDQEDV